MFTSTEIQRIKNDFAAKQKERKKTLQSAWGTLLVIAIFIIILFVFIFPNQFSNPETAWILPTYGGIGLLITLIGFIVSINFSSEKPFIEYLNAEVIQKINMHEGMFLEYKSYDKEAVAFNKIGGLFTRYASVKVRRSIEGNTEEHHRFNIYDCVMTTSSGNSQQTHFNGVYFVLEKQVNSSLQVRTKGSPKLKGIKFTRKEEIEGVRVYKEIESNLMNVDHQFIQFVLKLSENENYKRVYLSIVDEQIHLAIWFKKHPARKQKELTLESLNKLAEYFMSEYRLINDIAQIDAF